MSNVSASWRRDHPWAVVYRYFSAREQFSRPAAKLIFGADIDELFAQLRELDTVPNGGSVLDVPCGAGIALGALTPERDVRFVAADISPAMLRRTEEAAAARGLSQVQTLEANVEQLPFAEGEFDLCLSFAGLHCFPDPALAVREIARCLKPGGSFAGTIFLVDSGPRYAALRLTARAMGVIGPSGGLRDVEQWLDRAGLREVRVERLGTMARFSARKP
ncbi:MAG: class I SAM-dependent methyltransferase [Solirubrobacteraceae bacterium]